MKIKVIQFNIRTGFRVTEKPYSLEAKRMKYAKKLIRKENPDILLINEAYFESKNKSGILVNYREIFNYPYYAHGNYKNGLSPFWGSAILSKFPITKIKNKNRGLGGWLSCDIIKNKKVINLNLAHITPIPYLNSKGQEKEIKKILKETNKNCILAGDFNSLSPLDHYNSKEMIKSWSKITKNADKQIKEMLKRDAVKVVLSKGLLDTYKEKNKMFNYTIPTNFLSKDKSTGIRIDYIFCSKEFKVVDSGIIKNSFSENSSDHYPIYAILEI